MTIQQKFDTFHATNPHVFETLKTLALQTKAAGVQRWSINGLFEVLRWQTAIQTKNDSFKLNNSFRALYARKLMEEVPQLVGFFETRTLKAA